MTVTIDSWSPPVCTPTSAVARTCGRHHRQPLGPIGRWACDKQSPGSACECFTSSADKVVMMAAPQTPNAFTDFITVLVLVGLPEGRVSRALSRHAIDSSPDGVLVNVFNDLARLPRYREALETKGKPEAVVDLRLAAAEADAVLVVTSYRGRVPSMAHNAIDWLTRRRRHRVLHDKPFAVVGRSSGYYSGVLSRQVADARRGLGPRVIEPLTVRTLREAVKKLADEVPGGSAAAAISS
jgi:NAD(P)H-dependent FMN reductase